MKYWKSAGFLGAVLCFLSACQCQGAGGGGRTVGPGGSPPNAEDAGNDDNDGFYFPDGGYSYDGGGVYDSGGGDGGGGSTTCKCTSGADQYAVGQTEDGDPSTCETCGSQIPYRTCNASGASCAWGAWTDRTCDTSGCTAMCHCTGLTGAQYNPAQTETDPEACGWCNQGSMTRSRTCNQSGSTCTWSSWTNGACTQGAQCDPGGPAQYCDNNGIWDDIRYCVVSTCTWGACVCPGGGSCTAPAQCCGSVCRAQTCGCAGAYCDDGNGDPDDSQCCSGNCGGALTCLGN